MWLASRSLERPRTPVGSAALPAFYGSLRGDRRRARVGVSIPLRAPVGALGDPRPIRANRSGPPRSGSGDARAPRRPEPSLHPGCERVGSSERRRAPKRQRHSEQELSVHGKLSSTGCLAYELMPRRCDGRQGRVARASWLGRSVMRRADDGAEPVGVERVGDPRGERACHIRGERTDEADRRAVSAGDQQVERRRHMLGAGQPGSDYEVLTGWRISAKPAPPPPRPRDPVQSIAGQACEELGLVGKPHRLGARRHVRASRSDRAGERSLECCTAGALPNRRTLRYRQRDCPRQRIGQRAHVQPGGGRQSARSQISAGERVLKSQPSGPGVECRAMNSDSIDNGAGTRGHTHASRRWRATALAIGWPV